MGDYVEVTNIYFIMKYYSNWSEWSKLHYRSHISPTPSEYNCVKHDVARRLTFMAPFIAAANASYILLILPR